MAKLIFEHFQHGKLENKYTQIDGANFEIIATSAGLQDNINSIRDIPKSVLKLNFKQPQLTTALSHAYGWQPLGDGAVIGHFMRSPNIESPGRPFYFIQSHYILIPANVIQNMSWNLRPLFSLFSTYTPIPRYSKVAVLDAIEVDEQLVYQFEDFEKPMKFLSFIPALLSNEAFYLSAPFANAIERLNVLSALLRLIPPKLRREYPFITSIDRLSPDKGSFRIGFYAHEAPSNDELISDQHISEQMYDTLMQQMPDNSSSQYLQLLNQWNKTQLSDAKLDTIRYQNGVKITELENSAIFHRSYNKIFDQFDQKKEPIDIQSVKRFLDKYHNMLNQGELERVLTEAINSCNDERDNYETVFRIYALLKGRYQISVPVEQSAHWLRKIKKNNTSHKVKQIYGHVALQEPELAFEITHYIISKLHNSQDNDYLSLLNIIYDHNVENKITLLSKEIVDTLSNYDKANDVIQNRFWNIFADLSEITQQLSNTTLNHIRRIIPFTSQLLETIDSNMWDTGISEDWFVRVYEERHDLDLNLKIIHKSIKDNNLHKVLTATTFLDMQKIFHGKYTEEYISFVREIMYIISARTVEELISNSYNNFEKIHNLLSAIRDFLLIIKPLYKQGHGDDDYIYNLHLFIFELIVKKSIFTNISIQIYRNILFDWSSKFAKNAIGQISRILNRPIPLLFHEIVTELAIVDAYKLPPQYNERLSELYEILNKNEKEWNKINLYAWIVILRFHQKNASKQSKQIEILPTIQFIKRFFVVLGPVSGSVWNAYFIDLIHAINNQHYGSNIARQNLHQILYQLPYEVDNQELQHLPDVIQKLNKTRFYEEARIIENSLENFETLHAEALEIEEIFSSLDTLLGRLIDISGEKSNLTKDDRERWSSTMHQILKASSTEYSEVPVSRIYEKINNRKLRKQILEFLKWFNE